MNDADNPRLPFLRKDLEIHPGPDDSDGSPTYNLYDPVSGQYTRLGWAEATVLQRLRPGLRLQELMRELGEETTLRVEPEEVLSLCQMADRKNLTAFSGLRPSTAYIDQAAQRKTDPFTWLLHHYLYWRIPLLEPDAFLAQTLRYVRVFGSVPAWIVYSVIVSLGLFMLVGRVGEYLSTFPDFFSPGGALAFGVSLTVFKIIHEFAHAYVARSFGVRVRTMGVALIVFWPVPYCDVTDAWRLKRRRDRFLIGIAGVLAEAVLAGLALFLWGVSPPGVLKSVFFVASSTTLLSTLAVNINPAMRYDGYYLLCDLWGIDNLRARATAMTRWWLHKTLLGLQQPPPEEGLARRDVTGMLVYSAYAWTYRFFLYLGIAVLVYYKFHKAVGVVLFAAEIWIFIIAPFVREVAMLWNLRDFVKLNRRSLLTGAVVLGVLLWAALPLRRTLWLPAMTTVSEQQTVYVPREGFIANLTVSRGDPVMAGTRLVTIESPSLSTEIEVLEREVALLDTEIAALSQQENGETLVPVKLEERAKANAELARLRGVMKQCDLRAQVTGVVATWDETLREGRAVREGAALGEIVNRSRLRVVAFLKEDSLRDVEAGETVSFAPSDLSTQYIGTVLSVTPAPRRVNEYQALTSVARGELTVRADREQNLILQESYYRVDVELRPSDSPPPVGRTGILFVRSRPRSRLMDLIRYAYGVVIRESGM